MRKRRQLLAYMGGGSSLSFQERKKGMLNLLKGDLMKFLLASSMAHGWWKI